MQLSNNKQSKRERRRLELIVVQENDHSNLKAESENRGNAEWNNVMILTSENEENDWPSSISGRLVKSKVKNEKYPVEQVICRPRLLTGFMKNPTLTETTTDTRVEWTQQLTLSTGALIFLR